MQKYEVPNFTLIKCIIDYNPYFNNQSIGPAGYHSSENKTVMNAYIYTPELYQQGSSTASFKMFPNPARSSTTIYINSIQEKDNGEVVVYNTGGKVVFGNTIKPGNNEVNVAELANGIYIVRVLMKDKFTYTKQMVVMK